MAGRWLLAALSVAAWIFVGLRAVRWAINRAVRSREAAIDGTWQHDVKEQMLRDGPRFLVSVHYFVSYGAMFLCIVAAALFSAVPIWLGVLGGAMAILCAASVEARVRYGTTRLRDVRSVFRSWLRIPERPRYR
jgi:hypothetical protein